MEPPLQLKLVTLVLTKASDSRLAIDSVGACISDFLVADLSLSKAVELSRAESFALLDLVWARSLQAVEWTGWSVAKLLCTKPYYYKWAFSAALVQAVRRGDRGMVQWLLQHFSGCPVDRDVVEEAAKGGHLWVLQLLETDSSHSGIEWSAQSLDFASKGAHWEMARWLHQKVGMPRTEGFGFGTSVAQYALEQNNAEQLEWALQQGFQVSHVKFEGDCGVVGRDPWQVVHVMLDHDDRTAYTVGRAVIRAAEVGDLEFLKWLVDRYMTASALAEHTSAMSYAAETASKYGRIEMLEYLLAYLEDNHLPERAMYQAAKHGTLHVVKWLVDKYPRSSDVDLFWRRRYYSKRRVQPATAMDIAASHGHLKVLKFLHQIAKTRRQKRKREERDVGSSEEVHCTKNAMDLAAAHGHLEVVKWLHKHRREGCTVFAMNRAAGNGHLKVVQWLHANRSEGCTSEAVDLAAFHYCPMSPCCRIHHDTSSCGQRLQPRECYEPNTFVKKQLSVIQWLHENRWEGCTAKAMDGAAANGNFEMVKWLHENTDATCTHKVMDEAASQGRLDIVKWLYENRSEGCTSDAARNAAAGGHLEVVKWLFENHLEGCGDAALGAASEQGHFMMVRWLLEHLQRTRMSAESALRNNHLELGCYLYERQTPSSFRNGMSFDKLRDLSRQRLYLI